MNNNTLQLFDNINKNELTINLSFDFRLQTNSYKKQVSKKGKEIYKDIPEYEGHYQVSNKGNIKSLKKNKKTVLRPSKDKKGYYKVSLYIDGKHRKFYIHRLVILTFKGEIPKGENLVVDHIDNVKTNNELDNLQVISNRENLSKDKWRHNPSSFYTGVCYSRKKEKWESSISANGVSFHLGYFKNESNAALEYKKALEYFNEYSDLTNYSFKTKRRNGFFTDKYQLFLELTQF